MIKELVELIKSCPSAQKIKGGITCDYLDPNYCGICVKSESGIEVVNQFLDGTALLKRDYKVEIYYSFSGDTEESVSNHEIVEQLQNEIEIAPIPEIQEGKIVKIYIADCGKHVKSAVGEGITFFIFSVLYKAKRGDGEF